MIWVDTTQSGNPKLKAHITPGDQVPQNIKVKLTQGPDVANISNSVLSSSVQIQLSDPCTQTVINSQMIAAMAATTNQQTPTTQSF